MVTSVSRVTRRAAVRGGAHQRKELERLCRYVTRPASANGRFLERAVTAQGRLRADVSNREQGQLDRIPGFVQELIKSKLDILVAENVVAIRAAQRATKTIPIAMATSIDVRTIAVERIGPVAYRALTGQYRHRPAASPNSTSDRHQPKELPA